MTNEFDLKKGVKKTYTSEETIEKLIIFMARRRGEVPLIKYKLDEALMFSVDGFPKELCKKYFPEIYRKDEGVVSPEHVTGLFEKIINEHVAKGDIYYQPIKINCSKTEYGILLGAGLMQKELSAEEINELNSIEEKLYSAFTGKDL